MPDTRRFGLINGVLDLRPAAQLYLDTVMNWGARSCPDFFPHAEVITHVGTLRVVFKLWRVFLLFFFFCHNGNGEPSTPMTGIPSAVNLSAAFTTSHTEIAQLALLAQTSLRPFWFFYWAFLATDCDFRAARLLEAEI